MEKEVFDKKIINEAKIKLAEQRAKQNELDSIKGSVKMVSDALILLNNKMEELKSVNLKNVESAIANFEEFSDYHNKKIENYDNNFNIIKRKINSFNDAAADMLVKMKEACESLDVENLQDLSKQTNEYAEYIKDKFCEINNEVDKFYDVQSKMEQITKYVENIEDFNINQKIIDLSRTMERMENFASIFKGNLSYLESKVSDDGLVDKVNDKINSFDEVYASVDSMLEKTKSIIDNAELAEKTLNNICKYNEKERNNIEEAVQSKYTLLSENIVNLSDRILKERNNLEVVTNTKYDSINETLEKIVSYNKENIDRVINIKDTINDNNINTIDSINDFKDSIGNKIQSKFLVLSENLSDKIIKEKNNIEDFLNSQFNGTNESLNKIIGYNGDIINKSDNIKSIINEGNIDVLQNITDLKYKVEDKFNDNKTELEEINKVLVKALSNIDNNKEETVDIIENKFIDFKKEFDLKYGEVEKALEEIQNDSEENTNNIQSAIDEIHEKLNGVIENYEKSNEDEEKRYKFISEELPKNIEDNFKTVFDNILDKQLSKIEKKISHAFDKKFDEKINKLDSKINELENKINSLLEENKQLKEKISQGSLNTASNSGVQSNTNISMLERSALSGDIRACLELGEKYYKGIGVSQSFENALKYFKIGSGRGSVECNNKIIEIYKLLANKGIKEYQFLIGKTYLEGKMVRQDIEVALEWYKKAAKNGHEESKTALIRMYMMLANNNNPYGLYNMGLCYYEGFCVEKDLSKAYEYLNRAARLGHSEAIKMVNAS